MKWSLLMKIRLILQKSFYKCCQGASTSKEPAGSLEQEFSYDR